jgi:hypothetical protein
MAAPRFLDNTLRARLAVAGAAALAVASAAKGSVYLWVRNSLGDWEATGTIAGIEGFVDPCLVATHLFCAVTFLLWFRRAYGNAAATGHHNRHALGWAIGGWFVPFLNLVRPAEIAGGIWRHARAQTGVVGPVVGPWWTCFLVANLLERAGISLLDKAQEPDLCRIALTTLFAGEAVAVVGLWLAIRMVRGVTRAHVAMHRLEQAEVFA